VKARGLTEIGVGCAVGRGSTGYTVLWVQDFGRPRAEADGAKVRHKAAG